MSLVLYERNMENIEYVDIPSDAESICSVEFDNEYEQHNNAMAPGNTASGRQPKLQSDFYPNDDMPSSNMCSTSAGLLPNASSLSLSAQTASMQPKSKKYLRMQETRDYQEDGDGIPKDIIDVENITPIKIFRLFWPESLTEMISFQTNLYYSQTDGRFTPTTPEEVEVFLGLSLVMGIKKLPSTRDYWSPAPDLNDPYISSFMTHYRYNWHLKFLHLNDNNLMPKKSDTNYDKLYKVRPLLDILKTKFNKNYHAPKNVTINESIIKFEGLRYIPNKPIRRGYKVWMMCCESGYCLDFEINTGKDGDKLQTDLGKKIFFLKWKDKRSNLTLSNYIDPTKTDVDNRRERNGERNETTCPDAVVQYNSCMNYFNKFDQLRSTYVNDQKSRKWWHRIFFYFLDCAVINAFILHKELQKNYHPKQKQLTAKEFRRQVYTAILAASQAKKTESESNMHQPEGSTSLRCAKCINITNPTRTIYKCRTCKGEPVKKRKLNK